MSRQAGAVADLNRLVVATSYGPRRLRSGRRPGSRLCSDSHCSRSRRLGTELEQDLLSQMLPDGRDGGERSCRCRWRARERLGGRRLSRVESRRLMRKGLLRRGREGSSPIRSVDLLRRTQRVGYRLDALRGPPRRGRGRSEALEVGLVPRHSVRLAVPLPRAEGLNGLVISCEVPAVPRFVRRGRGTIPPLPGVRKILVGPWGLWRRAQRKPDVERSGGDQRRKDAQTVKKSRLGRAALYLVR